MQHRFATLDVFTDTRYAGNPLAVVSDADDLSDAAMQAIAREFNLSETVFLMRPQRPAHSARMRIFTPKAELPFAGHPTIGTAIYLAMQKSSPDTSSEQIVVLEQVIGTVRVGVRFRPGMPPFAEFDAPKLPQELGDAPSAQLLADALNLLPSEIGFQNHRPTRYGAGVPFIFVPVTSLGAIAKASINPRSWQAAFGTGKEGDVYLYTRETSHSSSHFHARMFGPALGIAEDPATGSAAAALAGPVVRFDKPPSGWHKRVIEQGFEMGRPSLITLSIEVEGGKLETVRIGGNAVVVSEGLLTA